LFLAVNCLIKLLNIKIEVLELGAGTSLPGITAALCGAQVTLSDSTKFPHCLEQCRRAIQVNGLEGSVDVIGLTWGYILHKLTNLRGKVDVLIGSDCFYDPVGFEDLIVTVAYLLENNPGVSLGSGFSMWGKKRCAELLSQLG